MSRRLPPLNWLRTFEAAARHLSFTAAARELHLTQAAVSQHVKLLEQHLGQRLFARLARSVRLTTAGAAYHPRLAALLDRPAGARVGAQLAAGEVERRFEIAHAHHRMQVFHGLAASPWRRMPKRGGGE